MIVANEHDLNAAELLNDFLPQNIFDAHVHLHIAEAIPTIYDGKGVFYREKATLESYCSDMGLFLGNVKKLRVNMMPMPDKAMGANRELRLLANAHINQQLSLHSDCCGAAYVSMDDTPDQIAEMIQKQGFQALKCYCFSARSANYEMCSIGEYLPESAWLVAEQYNLPIILHMMRPEALSDEDNFRYITKMARKYSKAKLVLAHCARGFAAWTVIDKIRELEDCGNIWFDLAAVCESAPIAACIMKNAGKRTVWGSDYPICMNRGKVISSGTGYAWLTGEDIPQDYRPCLVAAENLLAFRQAAKLLNLDQTQIQDIFYNNAMELFDVCKHSCL